MGIIDRQIRSVRKRQNTNLFLSRLAFGITVAAGLWAIALLAQRLFELGLPMMQAVWAAGGLAVIIGAAGTMISRVTPLQAAVRIDAAAGLKERVSTALAFRTNSDPFAQAATHDAEKIAAGVHVPTHVPYRAPREWPMPLAVVAAAALLYAFMPQMNLLAADPSVEPEQSQRETIKREQINMAIREQMERAKQRLEDKPQLQKLAGALDALEIPDDPTMKPDDIRRDVVKKVESVSEKIREQMQSSDLKLLEALKRDLAKLDAPRGDDAASKLAQALAKGDMQQAHKAMEDLKKDLEDAAKSDKLSDEQKAKLAAMRKKLGDLSAQLEKLAKQDRMEKELENKAGLSKEQAKKLLEQLKNMDPKQVEKALQKALAEKGVSKEQIKKLAQKMAQQKQLQQQMKQMAQAMQQAAQACKNPNGQGQDGKDSGEGQMSLDSAMGMMSDLEMADQMMQELQAQLSDLDSLKQGVCRNPNQGRPDSDKIGNQGPQQGLGYGATTGKQAAAHGYKSTKVKSQIRGGEIIGQMLVDGPQVKGELSAEAREAVNAAQRDATDAIEREEVPRQYEKVLREYFESLAGLAGGKPAESGKAPEDKQPAGEKQGS